MDLGRFSMVKRLNERAGSNPIRPARGPPRFLPLLEPSLGSPHARSVPPAGGVLSRVDDRPLCRSLDNSASKGRSTGGEDNEDGGESHDEEI